MDIFINYHNSPYYLEMNERGDGVDLYCVEHVSMKKGERKYISQGISMRLPEGYEAIVVPRSSTFKNGGIIQTNSIGVIDNSYSGDDDIGMFPAYATKDVEIPAGTRICQFRIQKRQPHLNFISVNTLGGISRGGLGSSGV